MNNFELIINPPLSSIAFKIFGYPIRFYGLIMAFSLFIGYVLIYHFFKKNYSIPEAEKFSDYAIYLVIFSFLGARIFYIIGSFDFYINNPVEMFLINHGGISIWGGIIFGILTLFVLSKIFSFSYVNHLGIIALVLPLCQAIGRWGNYFNQEAFGKPAAGFIKLFVSSDFRPVEFAHYEYFHPVFLYESILDIILFVILLRFFKKDMPLKTVFLYLTLYSLIRIIVESVRVDSIFNIGIFHIATIISIGGLITGILGLFLIKRG